MGTITTGIGLVSGIDSKSLIDQLIAIESRPKQLVQSQVAVLGSQQTAFQEINAKLLALKLSADNLTQPKLFRTTAASSSQPEVMSVSTTPTASPGTYSFSVARLVSSQQTITAGFADDSATPVGAGTLSFESAAASLSTDTLLADMNGGQGVTRGKIRISDRSGASAIVDLGKALSVQDVLTAINDASGINVTASVQGGSFVLTDHTGLSGTLGVANVGSTAVGTMGTATALGLTGAAAGDTLTGSKVYTLSRQSLLSSLNDGNGVHVADGDDLSITRRDGSSFLVDLATSDTTLGQVIDKIAAASGGNVTASLNGDGNGLVLSDTTTGGNLTVAASGSSMAARDLGLIGSTAGATLLGQPLIAGLNTRLLRNLQGGTGATLGTVQITNRAGTSFNVDLSAAQSVQDVLSAINSEGSQAGRGITATLNRAGNGLLITDGTGGTAGNLTITGGNAAALGLEQSVAAASADSGNLQLRYVSEGTRLASLNGGAGIARGKFTLTDSTGNSAVVDLSQGNELSIADVLSEINSRGLLVQARVNDTGDGILIEDTGPGNVKIKITESGSTTARDLGLLGEAANAGDDLDGRFEKTITLTGTETLNDLTNKINDAGLNIRATVIHDGSAASPYRLSLTSAKTGQAGAFLFDDGALDLQAQTLTKGQNAVVFFGSPDPAQAIAITSATNTLSNVITGATISLTGTSSQPVNINITRDEASVTSSVEDFVKRFNDVITSLNKYDSYDPEKKQKGLLLGDSTVSTIRSAMYRYINRSSGTLTGQFTALSQLGITVGEGAALKFNSDKFQAALTRDRDSVVQLFTYKTTESANGSTKITTAGVGVNISEMLRSLTDSVDGTLKRRTNSLTSQIKLNNDRIDSLDVLLQAKRSRLVTQFAAMESALSQLQSQGNALSGLTSFSNNNG